MPKSPTIKDEVAENEIITGSPTAGLQPITGAGITGEIDGTDLRFPKFQIVQGVGPLSEKEDFKKGDLVLNGEFRLSNGKDPVEIVVCQFGKMFEEVIPYSSEEIPRVVNTKQEVLQLKGSTEGYKDDSGTYHRATWRPIAETLIAIKAPKGLSDEARRMNFPFESPDGSEWSFAKWMIKGVAYKFAAVEIITAAGMYYKAGLRTGSFLITTKKEMFGPNAVMVPVVSKGHLNSAEMVSWLSTLA
jgi:hypothetical protein